MAGVINATSNWAIQIGAMPGLSIDASIYSSIREAKYGSGVFEGEPAGGAMVSARIGVHHTFAMLIFFRERRFE